MNALTRWLGSEVVNDETGMATFSVAGEVLAIRLRSFSDAQAIGRLISAAEKIAGDRARNSCAQYMRGAAAHMEEQS